jgi:CBS domain-containing protein
METPAPITVADVMRPALTTADLFDHVAAAAYLLKRAGASALTVLDPTTGQPVGIFTEKDITHAVADGKDLNEVRIRDLMTRNPTVVPSTATVREAAMLMTSRRFRHLPVMDDTVLVGMVDVTDVCRALIEPDEFRQRATGTAQPQ